MKRDRKPPGRFWSSSMSISVGIGDWGVGCRLDVDWGVDDSDSDGVGWVAVL